METQEAIQDFAGFLINLAAKEGQKFREENKREPTEAEVKRIAEMIQRQLNLALIMQR